MKQWEKEFGERFRRWMLKDGEENYGLYEDDWDAVKQFITNLLDQQKAEFVEIVRGMKKEPTKEELNWMSDYMENEPNNKYKNGYNEALKDVVKKVEES